MSMPKKLPDVGQIKGITLRGDQKLELAQLSLQYEGVDGVWYETNMPFLDAMYLLSLLRAVAQSNGFKPPEPPGADPRK